MTASTAPIVLSATEVIELAKTRIEGARDLAAERGDTELAEEIDDMIDDINEPGNDPDGVDRALPDVFAALMNVTLGDR